MLGFTSRMMTEACGGTTVKMRCVYSHLKVFKDNLTPEGV